MLNVKYFTLYPLNHLSSDVLKFVGGFINGEKARYSVAYKMYSLQKMYAEMAVFRVPTL